MGLRPTVVVDGGAEGGGQISKRPGNLRGFDLRPSEKLQLVEDLWDDLAAAPETVPGDDWQSRNWHAGKRIS